MDDINNILDEIARQQMEYTEKTLAKIITEYDFMVGSIECKQRLMEILPEGAKIVCSPYIDDPTMIYAIKKFDIMDLLPKPGKVDEYGRNQFNGYCPYNDRYCNKWTCDSCEVEKEERKLYDNEREDDK